MLSRAWMRLIVEAFGSNFQHYAVITLIIFLNLLLLPLTNGLLTPTAQIISTAIVH